MLLGDLDPDMKLDTHLAVGIKCVIYWMANRNDKDTVQGFSDASVPVDEVVGNQATLDRQPTTGINDVSLSKAGSKAEVLNNATAEGAENVAKSDVADEDTNPFARRGSVTRSPTVQKKLNITTQTRLEEKPLFRPDLKGNLHSRTRSFGSKRSRDETGEEEIVAIKTLMTELTKVSADLVQAITVNANTKMDIKNGVRKVSRLVDTLNSRIDEMNETPLKAKPRTESKKLISTATQTEMTEKEQEQENDKTEEIYSILQTTEKFNKLLTVIDAKWPENVYKITNVEEVNLHNLEVGENLAIILDPATKPEEKNMETVIQKIPALRGIFEDELKEGEIETLKVQTHIATKKRNSGKRNMIYMLPLRMHDNIVGVNAIYEGCKKLKYEMLKEGKQHITILTLGQLEMIYLRKCIEYLLKDSDLTVTIILKPNKRKKSTSNGRNHRGPEIQKIIVKAEGKSYAELVKNVKSSINMGESRIQVNHQKMTKKGDLMIEVEGHENAEKIKEAVKNNFNEVTVEHKKNETTLYLTNIDADMNEKEISEEIKKYRSDIKREFFKIISVRQMRNGNQAATIQMEKEAATHYCNMGSIKMGWGSCRIRRRIYILRCFRCLNFGHRTGECDGEDRSNMCLGCGEMGHKVKECKNTPFCTTCNIGGHKADQTKCPIFRRLINENMRKPSRRVTRKSTWASRNEVFTN